MRSILLTSVIGLAAVLATPASGHMPTECNSHLTEFSRLLSEKVEMQKSAIVQTQQLMEMKREFALEEMQYLVHGGIMEELQLNEINHVLEERGLVIQVVKNETEEKKEAIEQATSDLLRLYPKVFVFDSTGPGRALTRWMNCLADSQTEHVTEEYIPTMREWLDSR